MSMYHLISKTISIIIILSLFFDWIRGSSGIEYMIYLSNGAAASDLNLFVVFLVIFLSGTCNIYNIILGNKLLKINMLVLMVPVIFWFAYIFKIIIPEINHYGSLSFAREMGHVPLENGVLLSCLFSIVVFLVALFIFLKNRNKLIETN